MLERLARWLRVLGYDVVFANLSDPDGARHLREAASQGRIILSRNAHLATRRLEGDALFVESLTPLAQLSEVIERLQLRGPWKLFSRCMVCNTPLVGTSDAGGTSSPRGETTPGVPTRRCPACDRLYWEGVHTRRMRAALRRSLGPAFIEVT